MSAQPQQTQDRIVVGAVQDRSGDYFLFTVGAEARIGYELCIIHTDPSSGTEALRVAADSLQQREQPDDCLMLIGEAYKFRRYTLVWPVGGTTAVERNARSWGFTPAKIRQMTRACDPSGETGFVYPGQPDCPKEHAKSQSITRFLTLAKLSN